MKHLGRLGTRGFKVFIITGESSITFRQTWDTGFKVFIITGESSETFRQTWDMRV